MPAACALTASAKRAARRKSYTRAERKYRTEIEEIAVLTDMDIWNVEAWTYSRIERLKVMRDKFVRVEVIMLYTVIDEILTDIICDYYFPRKKTNGPISGFGKKSVSEFLS